MLGVRDDRRGQDLVVAGGDVDDVRLSVQRLGELDALVDVVPVGVRLGTAHPVLDWKFLPTALRMLSTTASGRRMRFSSCRPICRALC